MILDLASTTTGASVLNITASASSGNAAGVFAQSNAPNGAGLSGYNGNSGVGVYGKSWSGTAVYGTAPTMGVMGNATAVSGVAYGVKGQSASADGAGVYGISNHSSGVGVYGENIFGYGTGVRGEHTVEVLLEAGYTEEEIKELEENRVVKRG